MLGGWRLRDLESRCVGWKLQGVEGLWTLSLDVCFFGYTAFCRRGHPWNEDPCTKGLCYELRCVTSGFLFSEILAVGSLAPLLSRPIQGICCKKMEKSVILGIMRMVPLFSG